MSRLVIVSFAGLALAFYELSGGADFTPPDRATTETAAVRTAASAPEPAAVTAFRNRVVASPADTLVSGPVLAPYVTAAPATPSPTPAVVNAALAPTQRQDQAPKQAVSGAPQLRASLRAAPAGAEAQATQPLSLATSGLQIGALEGGLSAISATASNSSAEYRVIPSTAAEPVPQEDIREIRASRANIRLGPGTNFPVLTQLLAGTSVRILDEDPSGWALLEIPDSGDVGWIAASLLSAKGS